ncbi:hypothetical protein Q1695_004372 [Nippostrongylus brasiliensis]|nr:hypothetical protein Q1695_004372 [Nippostrongylus brasiliensis]
MQLFVPLIVSLVLDAALAYTEPECAHVGNATLCRLLQLIHQQNDDLLTIVRGASGKDVREAVSIANQAVTEALSILEETKLHSALKRALVVENTVLSYMKRRCGGTPNCGGALRLLFHATVSLVRAILETVVDTQKDSVQRAYQMFKNGSGNLTERASQMGVEVSAII